MVYFDNESLTWNLVFKFYLITFNSLCLNFFHPLARKPNLENKYLFIQTNSFIIFTCLNPVLLVPGFTQVGEKN